MTLQRNVVSPWLGTHRNADRTCLSFVHVMACRQAIILQVNYAQIQAKTCELSYYWTKDGFRPDYTHITHGYMCRNFTDPTEFYWYQMSKNQQALLYLNADLSTIRPLGTNLSEIKIKIQNTTISLQKIQLNMPLVFSWAFCLVSMYRI